MISGCSNQQLNRSEPESQKAADTSRASTNRASRKRRYSRILATTSLLVGVAAVVGVVLSIRAQIAGRISIARIGARLPALLVMDSSGRFVDAGRSRSGKKTIIVFYSPSCDVCQSELPKLQPFPAELGLIMINVSRASYEEPDNGGLQCDAVFYDRDRVFERSFSMAALPTILLVDEQGVLNAALVGAHQREVVQNKLSEFARAIPGK